MRWSADTRYKAGGIWRCRARHRELQALYYDNLDGMSYNRRKLLNRRAAALYRRRNRRLTEGS